MKEKKSPAIETRNVVAMGEVRVMGVHNRRDENSRGGWKYEEKGIMCIDEGNEGKERKVGRTCRSRQTVLSIKALHFRIQHLPGISFQ